MKKLMLSLLVVFLAACSKAEPTETVEMLAGSPERLQQLRQQCKADRAKVGDDLCNRAAEATNRRFMGNGMAPYTPPKDSPKF